MHVCFDTVLNADAVEFCPVKGLRDLLICGTYQLKESDVGRGRAEDQTRLGRLFALSVCQNYEQDQDLQEECGGSLYLEVPPSSQFSLTKNCELDCCGVFDIKFRTTPFSDGALLGHAAADGFLYTYKVANCDGNCKGSAITPLSSIDCRRSPEDTSALALSLDWGDRIHATASSPAAAISLSDGSLCVVDMREDGALEV